jgi:hypothetical protein
MCCLELVNDGGELRDLDVSWRAALARALTTNVANALSTSNFSACVPRNVNSARSAGDNGARLAELLLYVHGGELVQASEIGLREGRRNVQEAHDRPARPAARLWRPQPPPKPQNNKMPRMMSQNTAQRLPRLRHAARHCLLALLVGRRRRLLGGSCRSRRRRGLVVLVSSSTVVLSSTTSLLSLLSSSPSTCSGRTTTSIVIFDSSWSCGDEVGFVVQRLPLASGVAEEKGELGRRRCRDTARAQKLANKRVERGEARQFKRSWLVKLSFESNLH